MSLFVSCQVTPNASHTAPDDYFLRIDRLGVKRSARNIIRRKEEFTFKRTKGRGRRITISGSQVRVTGQQMRKLLKDESLGLSTLPRLTTQGGYKEVEALAGLLSSFRVFDVDVDAARLPSPLLSAEELELAEDMNPLALAPDASNLSAFLFTSQTSTQMRLTHSNAMRGLLFQGWSRSHSHPSGVVSRP